MNRLMHSPKRQKHKQKKQQNQDIYDQFDACRESFRTSASPTKQSQKKLNQSSEEKTGTPLIFYTDNQMKTEMPQNQQQVITLTSFTSAHILNDRKPSSSIYNTTTPKLGNSITNNLQDKRNFNPEHFINRLNLVKLERSFSDDTIGNKKKINRNINLTIFRQQQLIKEGYVMKKSASFLGGWQKRFLQLYENKLIYLENPINRSQIKGNISFINYDCLIQLLDKDTFRIELKGLKGHFMFQSKDAQSWYTAIQEQYLLIAEQSKENLFPKLKKEYKLSYMLKDLVSQSELQYHCDSGDLILFRRIQFNKFFSFFENSSTFDMSYLIAKHDDKLFICAQDIAGIKLIEYKEFMHQNGGIIDLTGLRRLHFLNKVELQQNFISLFDEFTKYSKKMKSKQKQNLQDNTSLIIQFYKHIGVLEASANRQNSPIHKIKDNQYKTKNGAWFSHLITVYPERHQETIRTGFIP